MEQFRNARRFAGAAILAILLMPAEGNADIAIRQAAGTDSSQSVAYNSQSHEYLVVWLAGNTTQGPVMAQRVSETGTLVGSAITITSFAFGRTTVAYNDAQNQYLIAYTTGILPDKAIVGQQLDANGTLVGSNITLMNMASHPKLLYNSIAGNYLLMGLLYDDVYSRKIGSNGQPLAAATNVTSSPLPTLR